MNPGDDNPYSSPSSVATSGSDDRLKPSWLLLSIALITQFSIPFTVLFVLFHFALPPSGIRGIFVVVAATVIVGLVLVVGIRYQHEMRQQREWGHRQNGG